MPLPNTTAIAEIVAKLLNHFGTVDEPAAVRKAIARDWVDDLAEFTVSQVAAACREWRRNCTIRPTIAEIRNLAVQAQHEDRQAIPDQRVGLDAEMIRLWQRAEYGGDTRTWQQRRAAALERQEARYHRAAAWRNQAVPAAS
jgi:predicted hydrolase (HD superfamily)